MPSISAEIRPALAAAHDEFTRWRRDLHRHPELGFEEERTAAFVVRELAAAGIEVETGVARTGVVGRLTRGTGTRAIGLRADMDALAMEELGTVPYRSIHAGRFHGCGHDGHTIMLLAAARELARSGQFDGTVYFIFQPAEDGGGGGAAMIAAGLFDRFPMDAVYGMHNDPRLAVGRFATRSGPALAAAQSFDIEVRGRGGHGAFPHLTIDPVLVAAQIVTALQGVVSRNVDPLETAVLSVTRMAGGDAYNVIPERATLGGTLRYFTPAVGERIVTRLREIALGIAGAAGARAEVSFLPNGYPPLINTAAETELAVRVASSLVGAASVDAAMAPMMGSEDFACMLERKPGCYITIGQGGERGGCMVHHPEYDFNDAILPLGASYWVRLVETALASRGG